MTKVYIDAGHGGTDPGAVGNGLKEKDLTLKISLYTRDYLLNNYKGVQVRLSRTTDKTLSLTQRTNDANSWKANSLVSVHINAAGSSATGYEDFIYNGTVSQNTRNLQNAIHEEMKKVFSGFTNRGKKRANFHMLRQSNAPAVLPEFLFITNKKDADFLRKDSNLKLIGKNLAIALAKHHKLSKKTTTTTSKPSTGTGEYVVKSGDTLWGIANKHGVTVDALKKANGLKSDTIQVGTKLTIPKSGTTTTAKPKTKYVIPKSSPVLRKGSKGAEVVKLQHCLNSANFKCGAQDGVFGNATEDALKRFQSVYANPADGIYGANSERALNKKLNG